MIDLLDQRGGLYMFKTLFLYLKSSNQSCNNNYIYSFSNQKIVGIDIDKYNTKSSRYSLQYECKIKPYPLSKEIFNNLFMYGINNSNHIRITNLELQDYYEDDIKEFRELLDNLTDKRYKDAIKKLSFIISEYETYLVGISFKYKGYDIKLGNEGIVRIDAPDRILKDFLYDYKINLLLLGARL